MSAVSVAASRAMALIDAERARDHLRRAREGYHLALVIAEQRGATHDEIAAALGTKPLYVTNTIRNHKANVCGCKP